LGAWDRIYEPREALERCSTAVAIEKLLRYRVLREL